MLVTAYFIVQKLFDFAWKAQLRLFYPTNAGYQVWCGDGSKAGRGKMERGKGSVSWGWQFAERCGSGPQGRHHTRS